MTEEGTEKEELEGSHIQFPINKKYLSNDLIMEPIFNPDYSIVPYTKEQEVVNFSQGTAAFFLDKIVHNIDVQATRERIKCNYQEGKSFQEKLKSMKSITPGQLFKAKGCRIGEDIMDIYNENTAVMTK